MSQHGTDQELAQRVIAAGDEMAFRELYRRHSPALYRIASRLGASDGSAEDLVQDTWIRAVERFAEFEWRSRLATWLTGILLNRIREQRRSDARMALDPEPSGDWPDRDPALDEAIDLTRAIAALPDGYRNVVVLHDIEGYQHAEIAEMLGLDVGTSKSQLSRARRALRRWLDPERRPA